MAGGDAALEQAWELIEIETSAERSKRRGTRMSTFADASDRMAASAEFREQRSTVKNRILRARSVTGHSQPGEQREDHGQSFHCNVFVKREWRASQSKTANTYVIDKPEMISQVLLQFGLGQFVPQFSKRMEAPAAKATAFAGITPWSGQKAIG